MRLRRAVTWAALAVVIALASFFRLAGLSNGLPHMPEADHIIVHQVNELQGEGVVGTHQPWHGDGVLSPLYPHMLAYAVHALRDFVPERPPPSAGLERHLEAAGATFLLTRRVIAVLSILIVPGTFLLARRFLPANWALVAALLCATSLLHLAYARQARPHGAVATFCAFSLVGSLWMMRSRSIASLVAAGVLASLAVGSLHNGAAVLPALLVGGVYHVRGEGHGEWRRRWWRLLVPCAMVGVAVWACYPFAIGDGAVFADRTIVQWSSFNGEGFARMSKSIVAFDPILSVLAAIGLLGVLWNVVGPARAHLDRTSEAVRGAFVVGAFVVPYCIAIGLYCYSWHRFLLPLLPIASVVGALGLRNVCRVAARALPGRWLSGAFAVVLIALALALPTYACARWVRLHQQPDSATLAAEWIEANVDREEQTVLLGYLLNLPLLYSEPARRGRSEVVWEQTSSPLERYQSKYLPGEGARRGYRLCTIYVGTGEPELRKAPAMRFLREHPADYAVVAVPNPQRAPFDLTIQAIRECGGELVHRIVPYRSPTLKGTTLGETDQYGYEALRVALSARRMGPLIEIYRLKPIDPAHARPSRSASVRD